ncbi:MAG: ABC-F family ATP-binding cassette domain-containing protein [Acidobacteriota bacterium]
MSTAEVLLTAEGLSKSYGARQLFSGLGLTLAAGDRVGMIGPNGAGKSTLLKILAGRETADDGEVALRRGVRVAYVPQIERFSAGVTVEEALLESPSATGGLEDRHLRVAQALTRAGFEDPAATVDRLSGGWRKRLSITRALVEEPDVLLLDEPTNHLDLESILWLEQTLAREPSAFLVISHDRAFLEAIARRMLEIDPVHPEGMLAVDGPYSTFLERRSERLEQQRSEQRTLANQVRREIEWLRRGPKARTTKAKSRVESAGRKIDALRESRERLGPSDRGDATGLDFDASSRRTKRLWVGEGLSKALGGRQLFSNLDLVLAPSGRLGLLGPNGAGKSTLLRVLVGELEPDAGVVERAPNLRVAYFEQHREAIDVPSAETVSLRQALVPAGGDSVIYRDRPVHVASWARRFLFRPEQLDTPISGLSGGERARIALARLMLVPADVLILDEPTNDLDLPTLEVLERSLEDFPGALVIVTHDRYLLDRLCDRILALDGAGGAGLFADVAQWRRARDERLADEQRERAARRRAQAEATAGAPAAQAPPRKKLSYNEKREFDGMEEAVLEAESRADAARQATEDPAVATDGAALAERFAALAAAQAEVDRLYARWAELEERAG